MGLVGIARKSDEHTQGQKCFNSASIPLTGSHFTRRPFCVHESGFVRSQAGFTTRADPGSIGRNRLDGDGVVKEGDALRCVVMIREHQLMLDEGFHSQSRCLEKEKSSNCEPRERFRFRLLSTLHSHHDAQSLISLKHNRAGRGYVNVSRPRHQGREDDVGHTFERSRCLVFIDGRHGGRMLR